MSKLKHTVYKCSYLLGMGGQAKSNMQSKSHFTCKMKADVGQRRYAGALAQRMNLISLQLFVALILIQE